MTATSPQQIQIRTDDGPMPAYRWLPAQGTGPGLVVVQEIFGVSDYIAARASDLAAAGFVVVCPDLYWRLPGAELDEQSPDVLEQAMALAGQLPWDQAVADTAATLAQLRKDPAVRGGRGLVGFCYGGGLAFQVAAERDPDVLVSYYGSALPDLLHLAGSVTCPSMHHFGTADTYLPLDVVADIRQAVTGTEHPAKIELYEGAGHAFDNPAPAFHHIGASAIAWPRTLAFLAAHLGRT